jgi:hypothetical protein
VIAAEPASAIAAEAAGTIAAVPSSVKATEAASVKTAKAAEPTAVSRASKREHQQCGDSDLRDDPIHGFSFPPF